MGYLSTNNFSKKYGIPRDFIRRLIAESRCPGFRSGASFKINEEMLIAQLEDECRRNASGSETSR